MTHEYYDVDVERFNHCVFLALDNDHLNNYVEIRLVVNERGQVFAKRILTRAKFAKRDRVWNLAHPVKRILDWLNSVGAEVYLVLCDDLNELTESITYEFFIENAIRRDGKDGQCDYWQCYHDLADSGNVRVREVDSGPRGDETDQPTPV